MSKEFVQEVMLKKPGIYCRVHIPAELARIGKYLKPKDMINVSNYEPWAVYEIHGAPMLLEDAIMLNIPHLNNSEILEIKET